MTEGSTQYRDAYGNNNFSPWMLPKRLGRWHVANHHENQSNSLVRRFPVAGRNPVQSPLQNQLVTEKRQQVRRPAKNLPKVVKELSNSLSNHSGNGGGFFAKFSIWCTGPTGRGICSDDGRHVLKEKLHQIPNPFESSKMVDSAYEVGDTSGTEKGFKIPSKGVSLGLSQPKLPQVKDPSSKPSKHGVGKLISGEKKSD